MASSDSENIANLHGLANWLSQSLTRELVRLGGANATPGMKELYDQVYLPRLVTFSEHAGRHRAFEDLQLLRQPLNPDLAATQLRIVIELLQLIVIAL
jgi:hypothetical protein